MASDRDKWEMDDDGSSIVVIRRCSEEDDELLFSNPSAQTASYHQQVETRHEEPEPENSSPGHSPGPERAAAGDFPGVDQNTAQSQQSSTLPAESEPAMEESLQGKDHEDVGNGSSQATTVYPETTEDFSIGGTGLSETPPGEEEPQGRRSPSSSSTGEGEGEVSHRDDSAHGPDMEGPPKEPTPAQGQAPPGIGGPSSGAAHLQHQQGSPRSPDMETSSRGSTPTQGGAPPDQGNVYGYPPGQGAPSPRPPGSAFLQHGEPPRQPDKETPPRGPTPTQEERHGSPYPGYPYGAPPGHPSPSTEVPRSGTPPSKQDFPRDSGEKTRPMEFTPTQGYPQGPQDPRYPYGPSPGYPHPSPEMTGPARLPAQGSPHASGKGTPPGASMPTQPPAHVDPRYFQGYPHGYQGPPPQAYWPGQHPAWPPQQGPGYSLPFPPMQGHPRGWPPPPPYTASSKDPSKAQRPGPVRPSPTSVQRGASPSRASPQGMKSPSPRVGATARDVWEEDDDIRPEDSVSCTGFPRERMTLEEKMRTWKQAPQAPDAKHQTPSPSSILQVKKLPDSVTDDDVADFFEHKKRGRFTVEKVEINQRARTALVYFQDPSAVAAVLSKGPHVMEKQELVLAAYSPPTEQDSDADCGHVLQVTGLPPGTDEDDVADFFENRRRGSFAVDRVQLDRNSASALVFFRSPEAVEAVLQKGPFLINKKRVEARPYSPPSPTDPAEEADSGCILEVSGLPEDVDEDDIADFFENKKRGGFEVKKVETDEEEQTALVYFCDPSALDVILQKAPFTMNKVSITVKPYVPEEEIDPRCVLHVTGLPESVDEEDVADFFENKRRGGFTVKKVDLDEKSGSALVHFEDVSAVETVLQKAPLKLQKKQIEVKQFVPEKKKDYSRMLLVKGLPTTADEDDVADYFESKRRGAHKVEGADIFPKQRTAVIYFEDPEAISIILEKSPWKMSSKEMEVSRCTAGALKKVVQAEGKAAEGEDKEEPQEEDACYVLQVADLPGSVDEDYLSDFFESRRNSGGCPVSKVELDQTAQTALVYFEDPSAVDAVLQKAPFLINKKKISVSAYTPSPSKNGQSKGPARTGEEEEEEEEEESCVVAVRGHGDTRLETLEMYFENSRKSGGQDVQSCTLDEKKGVVYVTFKSPEVARRVSEKTDHRVAGRALTVSLHRARPCYSDRVFLSDIPAQVSRESLVNFLEARAKLSPRDILYGEEEGTALVTFHSDYDLSALEAALRQRTLEGRQVRARPVAVSDAVLVRGAPPHLSRDALELYFDNARKSGGEDVQRVESLGEGAWVVTFAQPQVATRVSGRSHSLGGVPLQVSLYVDCLGPGGGDPDPCTFPVPPPLSLPAPHPLLPRFLRESPSQGQAFSAMLVQHHAQAELDDDRAGLRVRCTLTRETRGGKRLAKTWAADVEAAVRDFLGRLQTAEVRMTATVFTEVEKEREKFQPPADKALVFSKPGSSTLHVIGQPKVVEKTVEVIRKLKEQLEAELERKRQTVTETVTSVKKHQLKFLAATNFPAQMMKEYQGLRVDISVPDNKVVFTGLFNHVKDTQIKMFQTAQNLSSDKLKISKTLETLLKNKSVEQYVSAQLRSRRLVAVWELADRELRLWAATDQDVVQAAHVVKAAVQERTLDLDRESLALLQGKEWKDIKRKAEGQEGRLIIAEDAARSAVVVAGVEECLAGALEDVRNFFTENTVYQQKIRFPPGRQRFLAEHLSPQIHALESNNRAYHVTITFGKRSPEFKLEGTKEGLARVMKGLRDLAASVKREKHTLNDPGLVEFLHSERGREVLTVVQTSGRCVIRHQDDETDQPTVSGGGVPGEASGSGGYRLGNNATLRVIQGDLTALKVGAIVNAANDRLKHIGGLAKAISDKAGPSLQEECNAYIHRRGFLNEGEVMVSGAGSLPCQKVIHAVGPRYQGGQAGEEARLKAAVSGSLQAAHSLRLASIALPAISSGIFGYPVREATQVIVEAVVEFFRDSGPSTLGEVVLCASNAATLSHFHNAAAKLLAPVEVDAPPEEPSFDGNAGGHSRDWSGARPRGSLNSSRSSAPSGRAAGLRAVTGEMAHQTVDVMVNTTSSSLNLSQGAVSKSLLRAGGQELQTEVNSRYPQGLPQDQSIAITSAGRLSAKRIFHTSLPDWNAGGEKFLRTLIKEAIQTAETQGFSSIAFPVLGTGVLSYPRDVVARCFQEIASSLLPACRSLSEVRIVIFPADQASVKAFGSMLDRGGTAAPAPASGQDTQSATPTRPAPAKTSREKRSFARKPPASTVKGSPQPGKSDEGTHAFHIKDITLVVKQGNILEEQVDAIVNSTNAKIDLRNGAVAQAIVKACGQPLEDECRKPKKQSKMKTDGVVVTKSPGLKCKDIIHVNGDHFQGKWKDGIKACLQLATDKKMKSVAFPALGTGNRSLKPDDSATAFIEAIRELQKSQSKGVSEVRVVIYQPGMFDSFAETIKKVMETPEAKSEGWFTKIVRYFTGETAPDGGATSYNESPAGSDGASITLYMFSDRPVEIQQSLDQIRKTYHSSFITQKIENDVIKNLADEECKMLTNLEGAYRVQVTMKKSSGKVTVKGPSQHVIDAVNQVHTILREMERERQMEEGAEVVSTYVKWCYLEGSDAASGLKEYDKKTNATIEREYQRQSPSVTISDSNGCNYVFDFNSMEEYPEVDPNDKVKIIRRDLLEKEHRQAIPDFWASMSEDEELKVVPLTPQDPEYVTVRDEFMRTLGGRTLTITQIERIQNRTLHDQYMTKKQALDKQNGHTNNEKKLWHGTAGDAVVSINNYGFNRSYCGKNATAFGDGVYFAVNSSYSTQTTYSPPDKKKERKVYYVRVLTGDFTAGQSGIRVPPSKKGHVLYDSVVNNMTNPIMYIVFNDTQAYPDYLVTFH